MSTMLYKANGNVKIWGMKLQIITVEGDEIENYLGRGEAGRPGAFVAG